MALEWTEWSIEEKEWSFLPRSCRLSLVPENLLNMLEEERNLPVGEAPENQQGFSQRPTRPCPDHTIYKYAMPIYLGLTFQSSGFSRLSFSLFYHLCCSFPSGKGNSRPDHVAWVREDCVNWMKGHRCTISPKPIPMCNRIQFPLNETVYGLRCLRLPVSSKHFRNPLALGSGGNCVPQRKVLYSGHDMTMMWITGDGMQIEGREGEGKGSVLLLPILLG